MTTLIQKTKSVRKTFTVPNYISKELKEYALSHNQKQSQIVSVALEEYLEKYNMTKKVEKRVEAFEKLIGILPEGSTKNLDYKELKGSKYDT